MRSRQQTNRRAPALLVLGLMSSGMLGMLASCKQNETAQKGPAQTEECAPTGDKNADVMNALSADCAGCHSQGSNKPFFVSLTSFETTLVYDPQYVVPGDPDKSPLIALLKGQGTGTFAQMPTSGPTFFANDKDGKTKIHVSDLEDWIKNLPPQGAPSLDYLKAATVRRLSADQVLDALDEPLGLDSRDMFQDVSGVVEVSNGDLALPARSPDALGISQSQSVSDAEIYPRYLALGGAGWFDGKAPDQSFSSTFLETLTQVSQARCRAAVDKPGNTAFFAFAKLGDQGKKGQEAIKKNIGYLYLRLLGEPPTPADVDDLYQHVFVPYEATDTETAWIAVCASLVRHPLWATY